MTRRDRKMYISCQIARLVYILKSFYARNAEIRKRSTLFRSAWECQKRKKKAKQAISSLNFCSKVKFVSVLLRRPIQSSNFGFQHQFYPPSELDIHVGVQLIETHIKCYTYPSFYLAHQLAHFYSKINREPPFLVPHFYRS